MTANVKIGAAMSTLKDDHVVKQFHSKVANQARLRSRVPRVVGLQYSNGGVTFRQPDIDIYQYNGVAWLTGGELEYAYSMAEDDVGEVVSKITDDTAYVVNYYDTEALSDAAIRYLGGPIARERFADEEAESA